MTADAPFPATVEEGSYLYFGKDFKTFFFSPLFAGGIFSGVPRRSQVQRATTMRPETQITAQSKAAKMTTKSDSAVTEYGGSASASTAAGFGGGGEVEEELVVFSRNLGGRVII